MALAQSDALLLAARELGDALIDVIFQMECLEEFEDLLLNDRVSAAFRALSYKRYYRRR